MTYTFVLGIVHRNRLENVQETTNLALKNMILFILAAIVDFWPPSWIWGKMWGGFFK